MKQHKTLSFLSITTVVFHRSHYTTMSTVGMHKIIYEKHVSICLTMLCLLCYGLFPGLEVSYLLAFGIQYRVDVTV